MYNASLPLEDQLHLINCTIFRFNISQILQHMSFCKRDMEFCVGIISSYGVMMVMGITLNLLVIAAFLKSPRLRSIPLNYCILQLAVSDLFLCCVTSPTTLYAHFALTWPHGDIPCKFVSTVQAFNLFVSSFTLGVIAIGRWLWVVRQPSVVQYLTFALPNVWMLSLVLAVPYGYYVETARLFNASNNEAFLAAINYCSMDMPVMCSETQTHGALSPMHMYYTLVFAIQYLCPLGALIVAYTAIALKMRSRLRKPMFLKATLMDRRRYQRTKRSFLLQVLLVAVYALFWLPINVYNFMLMADPRLYNERLLLAINNLAILSASINPIMYGIFNENFNAVLRDIMPCWPYVIRMNSLVRRTTIKQISSVLRIKERFPNSSTRYWSRRKSRTAPDILVEVNEQTAGSMQIAAEGSSYRRRIPNRLSVSSFSDDDEGISIDCGSNTKTNNQLEFGTEGETSLAATSIRRFSNRPMSNLDIGDRIEVLSNRSTAINDSSDEDEESRRNEVSALLRVARMRKIKTIKGRRGKPAKRKLAVMMFDRQVERIQTTVEGQPFSRQRKNALTVTNIDLCPMDGVNLMVALLAPRELRHSIVSCNSMFPRVRTDSQCSTAAAVDSSKMTDSEYDPFKLMP